jgi:hypothetical protein
MFDLDAFDLDGDPGGGPEVADVSNVFAEPSVPASARTPSKRQRNDVERDEDAMDIDLDFDDSQIMQLQQHSAKKSRLHENTWSDSPGPAGEPLPNLPASASTPDSGMRSLASWEEHMSQTMELSMVRNPSIDANIFAASKSWNKMMDKYCPG